MRPPRIRREDRPRRAERPLRALIPNAITVMSLCAGLTSIRYALDGNYSFACVLIIAAALLDGLDGRAARLLRSTSKLGAELDSLADFLSFGVAPALLLYLWSLHGLDALGWPLALIFATCCALRLARFNAQLDEQPAPWMAAYFTGVPAPAGAMLALLPLFLALGTDQSWPQHPAFVGGVTALCGVLMVSALPTFSGKKLRVPPAMILPFLLATGLGVALLSAAPWRSLALLVALYALSVPLASLTAARARRRAARNAAAAEMSPPIPLRASEEQSGVRRSSAPRH